MKKKEEIKIEPKTEDLSIADIVSSINDGILQSVVVEILEKKMAKAVAEEKNKGEELAKKRFSEGRNKLIELQHFWEGVRNWTIGIIAVSAALWFFWFLCTNTAKIENANTEACIAGKWEPCYKAWLSDYDNGWDTQSAQYFDHRTTAKRYEEEYYNATGKYLPINVKDRQYVPQ